MPNQNDNNKNQGRKDNIPQKGNQQQEQERTPQRQQQGQQGGAGAKVPGAPTGLEGDQNKKGSAIDNEDEVEDEDQAEGARKPGSENEQRRP